MKNKTEWKHPELKDGEMFLSNSTVENLDLISWKQKRVGLQAFDCNNEIIDPRLDLYSIFVQRTEYENWRLKR